MPDTAFVTVIMPTKDEERYIGRCLESIIANDYPTDRLEVLVIDGMSTDRTRVVVEAYYLRHPFIRLMDNPRVVQTKATNIGVRQARGDVIIRMDAHAEYPADFISKSVRWLEETGADCVGGVIETMPGSGSTIAGAIALALSHPFGVGNARFRTGAGEPQYADTVPFGCYRRDAFERVGLFNEALVRTDDIEFNLRLRRGGGKVLLVPEIKSRYFARPDLVGLFRQNFGNGFWVIYSLNFARLPFSPRHLVPFVFLLTLTGSILLSVLDARFLYLFGLVGGAYLASDAIFSFMISLSHGFGYFIPLTASFATLHISYGLGSFWGIAKTVLRKSLPRRKRRRGLSGLQRFLKRSFDIAASSTGLLLTWWIILAAFIVATIDTRRNGFFTQKRVGMGGKIFNVIKIRTMRDMPGHDTVVTASDDPRITPLGKWLRKTKIDELPQLLNVLVGQMSLVGPRPDVPGFADRLKGGDRIILSVRPGITGPATLRFRNEEELLASQPDPEAYNEEVLFPEKVKINRSYVENYSFLADIIYIFKTILGRGNGHGG